MEARLALAVMLVALAVAAAPAEATFPGRNGGIAYVASGSSGEPGPVRDVTGLELALSGRAEPRRLISCELTDGIPSGGDCTVRTYLSPSFSPNGRRIVFDAGAQLAVMSADGSGLSLLPATSGNDGDPAFSPDGRSIAFTGSNDRGTTDLYVRRLDGGAARAIVLDASAPAWSSRNRIAYVRDGNVYTSSPDGHRRRFVTSGVSPDWSPGGQRLALVRPGANFTYSGVVGRLYVVGAKGRGLRRIGTRNDLASPVWSPDGRWLAFGAFDQGVYKRRVAGPPRARQVAQSQYGSEGAFVASSSPAWRPR